MPDLFRFQSSLPGRVFALATLMLMTACSSPSRQAPVVERQPAPQTSTQSAPVASSPAPSRPTARPTVTASERSGDGRSATYVVKRGDTLYSIALDHGQDYREVAAWNRIEDVNLIKIGQVLRVLPPEATQAAPVAMASAPEVKPLTATPLPPVAARPEVSGDAKGDAKPDAKSDTRSDATRSADGGGAIQWAWPASGAIIEGFQEGKNKGVDLSGKAGDPVTAASEGKVVYAGSGLRGYGNLVIIKHNADFLSAYAHNSKLLVREGEAVKRGQRIAEMGNSDADRVKLHFEVRRRGTPVDPQKFLPDR